MRNLIDSLKNQLSAKQNEIDAKVAEQNKEINQLKSTLF
mgnify:CR=1 FL=1